MISLKNTHGGSLGRISATGDGVAIVMDTSAKKVGSEFFKHQKLVVSRHRNIK